MVLLQKGFGCSKRSSLHLFVYRRHGLMLFEQSPYNFETSNLKYHKKKFTFQHTLDLSGKLKSSNSFQLYSYAIVIHEHRRYDTIGRKTFTDATILIVW